MFSPKESIEMESFGDAEAVLLLPRLYLRLIDLDQQYRGNHKMVSHTTEHSSLLP